MSGRFVGVWVLACVAVSTAVVFWIDAPFWAVFLLTPGLFSLSMASYHLALEVHFEYRRNRRDRVRTGSGNDPGGPFGHSVSYTIAGDPTTHSPGTRVVEEPIKAWKAAHLCFYPGNRAAFAGYAGAVYGAEATAECRQQKKHSAPDPKCGCGFYALKDRDAIGPPRGSSVVLEVELYGNVMVGEKGYRAEKQRVLAVYASRDFHAQYCQYQPVSPCATPVMVHRGAIGYVNAKTGHVLCTGHAIRASQEDHAPIREFVHIPKTPDTGTEWHWVDEK